MNNTILDDNTPRKGCVDVWNAFMVKDARFTLGSDIPICPCDRIVIPRKLISYEEAKKIYKKELPKDDSFYCDSYIHFYMDDQKFDNHRYGIWYEPYKALEIIRHFSGVISPDFSTNLDFPDAIKRYNTYRMRAFGYWLTTNNVYVINNVRWGTQETWDYCFDGIPYNSIVSIGTVASGIHKLKNRPMFEDGLFRMIELLNPKVILVYGSSNYNCFKHLSNNGLHIVSFPSQTSLAYLSKQGGDDYEQT